MADDIFYIKDIDRAAAEDFFQGIKRILQNLLPPEAAIHHADSTVIQGCITKGDDEICGRGPKPLFKTCDEALGQHYTRNLESDYTDVFAAFADDDALFPLGIQLVAIGSENDIFLPFLNALQNNPALVEAYNKLKITYDTQPMDVYRKAKSDFIADVLKC